MWQFGNTSIRKGGSELGEGVLLLVKKGYEPGVLVPGQWGINLTQRKCSPPSQKEKGSAFSSPLLRNHLDGYININISSKAASGASGLSIFLNFISSTRHTRNKVVH